MRTVLLGGVLLMLVLAAGGCPVAGVADDGQLTEAVDDAASTDEAAAEVPDANEPDVPSVWDVAGDVYDVSWRETWDSDTSEGVGDGSGDDGNSDNADDGNTGGSGAGSSGGAANGASGNDGADAGSSGDDGSSDNDSSAVRDPNDAVDQVARQVVAAGVRCAMCVPLADERLDMNSAGQGQFGECPVVGFADDGDSGLISMMFGYDDGCSGPLTGGITLTGSVAVIYDQVTDAIELYFLEMPGGVKEIPGEIHGTYAQSSGGASVAGAFTLDSDATGTISGDVALAYSSDDITTINSASWYADAEGYAYDLTCTAIVINQVTTQSFIPTSGTVSFNVDNPAGDPATLPVVIAFNAQSSATSVVSVQIGDDPPFDHYVSGMGP
ncbi:MAG: hypothetical protein JXO22_05065 [Phycisphaerae bacterium]|nr:hypothetical protein [Phycisphaerae bacterium]